MGFQKGTILAYGELLWDKLPSGPVLGGAPANFAYRLSTLGRHALTVSRVGADDLGKKALEELTRREVDISLVQVDTTLPTGTVDVTLNQHGDADFRINENVAYDAIELSPELLTAATGASVVYYGTLIQRAQKSRQTLEDLCSAAPDALRVCDLNLRKSCYDAVTVRGAIERASILKLNSDEVPVAAALLGLGAGVSQRDFAKAMSEQFGVLATVVTLGAAGAYARSVSGEEVLSPGFRVPVKDTIGSGDSFTAGFLHSYLQGQSLKENCDAGNRLGALVASKSGGMCQITPLELREFGFPARGIRMEADGNAREI